MIGIAQRDDVLVAGVGPGHEHGDVVGLGARIDEVADFEVARHFSGQGAPELGDIGVKVNGGGVLEGFVLLVRRCQDVRVAVADRDSGDAGERVEVAPALVVSDVLAFAFHDHERLLVEMEQRGVQELLAEAIDFVSRWAGVGLGLVLSGRHVHKLWWTV